MLVTAKILRWSAYASAIALAGCGGRSQVGSGDAGAAAPMTACQTDSDCPNDNRCETQTCTDGYCSVTGVRVCDDMDDCTTDRCEPTTGSCVFTHRSNDNDGDGFYGPLLGTQAGAAGSCGTDCNDANASVYPGAPEICDGFDNNCDGRVDEGAYSYWTQSQAVRITSSPLEEGYPQGLAYNGSYFGLTLTAAAASGIYQGYFAGYDNWGRPTVPLRNESETSVNTFASQLIWNGSVFATAWEVNSNRGYEIYFNRLDALGRKMGPDLQLTFNQGFSIDPMITWDGSKYWVLWADDNDTYYSQIYAIEVSASGVVVGEPLQLTQPESMAGSPRLFKSPSGYLLSYYSDATAAICMKWLGNDLAVLSDEFCVTDKNTSNYSIAWVKDRFVLTWSTEELEPGNTIWGATMDDQGRIMKASVPLVQGAQYARSPSIVSLGDRFAMTWADDRNSYNHYGVRFAVFSADLERETAVQTVAEGVTECWYPSLAAGGMGLAIVYRERSGKKFGVPYFVGLSCQYASGAN